MPFEIAPQVKEAPAKVGKYQHLADALLRGAAMTEPIRFGFYKESIWPWVRPRACAMGALKLGLGEDMGDAWGHREVPRMRWDYFSSYGTFPETDNDVYRRTREEIAERIRAL